MIESWPTPNYINPETRGPGLLILSIILIILGAIIVSVRTYTRLRITKAFGLDDVLVIIAYVLAVALSSLVIIGNTSYYSGRHIWDVPTSTFVPHRHNIWASELIYVLASSAAKISVLLFYRRLSMEFTSAFLWATHLGLAVNLIYLVFFVVWLCTLCQSLDAYWKSFSSVWRTDHKFHCRTEQVSLPLSAGLSMLTDLYATLLPLILITSIQKSTRDKTALWVLLRRSRAIC